MLAYGQCIQEVEHAPFIPIVLAATGGLAHETTIFISVWLLCCPQSGGLITQWLWAGLDAAQAFLRFVQQFNVFVGCVRPLVFTLRLHHQWI